MMTNNQGEIQEGALRVMKWTAVKVRLTGIDIVIQRLWPVFGWITSASGVGVRAALREALADVCFFRKVYG